MTTKHLVRFLSLSLTLAACATDPEPTTSTPTPEAIAYAAHLEVCDPTFVTELTAVTTGQSDVEPEPSSKCNLDAELLAADGCGFAQWWNWVDWKGKAACVAVGLPLCYATICVGGSL